MHQVELSEIQEALSKIALYTIYTPPPQETPCGIQLNHLNLHFCYARVKDTAGTSSIKQTCPLPLCMCRSVQTQWAWFFILIIIFHFIPISIVSCPIKRMWLSITTLGHLTHTGLHPLMHTQVGYPGMHIHCTHMECGCIPHCPHTP